MSNYSCSIHTHRHFDDFCPDCHPERLGPKQTLTALRERIRDAEAALSQARADHDKYVNQVYTSQGLEAAALTSGLTRKTIILLNYRCGS